MASSYGGFTNTPVYTLHPNPYSQNPYQPNFPPPTTNYNSFNNGYHPNSNPTQMFQPLEPMMTTTGKTCQTTNSVRSWFVFILIGGGLGLLLILYLTGVLSHSYVVMYHNGTKVTTDLPCYAQNVAHYVGSKRVICSPEHVCATSADRRGTVSKGCMEDRGRICEYIYMSDFKAKQPEFSHNFKPVPMERKKRGASSSSSRPVDWYHVCYCRTELCNSQGSCRCNGGGHPRVGKGQSIFIMILSQMSIYFSTI